MRTFIVLFLFACIVGSFGKHFADYANPCHTPDQLNGRMLVVTDSGFTLEMYFQNDNRAKAQRYTSHNPNMQFDTILLYDRGLQYTLANNGSYCHVSQIGHDFYPIAVPDSAHYLGEGDLAGEMGVQSFGLKFNNSGGVMMYMAEDTCMPAYVITKSAGHTSLTTFLDVGSGVDPDAFNVPAACSNSSIPTPSNPPCKRNVRRGAKPQVVKLEARAMSWDVPAGKRGQSWLKL